VPLSRASILIDCRMIRAGGIGTYLRRLLPILVAKDRWNFLFAGDPRELLDFDWIPPEKILPCTSRIYSPFEQVALRRVSREPHDLFWAPHYNIPLLGKGPLIITLHDVFHISRENREWGRLKKSYARRLIRTALRKADLVMTDSKFTLEEISKYGLPGREKVRVVPLGVSPAPPGPSPRESGYLLYVGNVKPHKNLIGLANAYASALRSGADLPPLKIAGKTSRFFTGEEGLEKHIDQLELRGKILLLGEVTEAELASLYRGAVALVFPSQYEGFGLPPLEAMSYGVPVLASRKGSLPEVCGEAVLYCDADSHQDMAAKLVRLCFEKDLRDDLIHRGRKQVQRYTWQKTAEATANLLSEVLRRTSGFDDARAKGEVLETGGPGGHTPISDRET
jgi:glycosyltransferase involved in cell wall biosynthesis